MTVDNNLVATSDVMKKIPNANDRWYLHPARDDRSMSAWPTRFRANPQNLLAIKCRRLAGRQVMTNDDCFMRQLSERSHWLAS